MRRPSRVPTRHTRCGIPAAFTVDGAAVNNRKLRSASMLSTIAERPSVAAPASSIPSPWPRPSCSHMPICHRDTSYNSASSTSRGNCSESTAPHGRETRSACEHRLALDSRRSFIHIAADASISTSTCLVLPRASPSTRAGRSRRWLSPSCDAPMTVRSAARVELGPTPVAVATRRNRWGHAQRATTLGHRKTAFCWRWAKTTPRASRIRPPLFCSYATASSDCHSLFRGRANSSRSALVETERRCVQ